MGCLRLTYQAESEQNFFQGLWKKDVASKNCDNYYPFGLAFNSYERENSVVNKYRYNKKEFQDDLAFNMYYYGARFYDPAIGKFSSIDPHTEKYNDWTPYLYAANDPIRYEDTNGEGPGDKVLGAAAALLDNASGGFFNLREAAANYVSENGANDFNTGLDIGDHATIAAGVMMAGAGGGMIEGGTGAVTVGLAAELPSGGTSTVVVAAGGTAVLAGTGLVIGGTVLATSAAANLANQKGRLSEGDRRKNRLPDKGEPNSVSVNKPGTTAKKYGKDGNVQKEFNKGHGKKAPKKEQKDHVHDYKPNPKNPSGRGDRQPGRTPKKNELKKDFGL